MATVTRIEYPNYSGMLFRKGNARTPFSTLIGQNQLTTNHVEFSTGVTYNAKTGSQPAITETASLTAPTETVTSRSQDTNVTQIFQYSVAVSYAKESDMGTLSGLNAAGQTANPASELDFQVMAAMEQANADIEYTLMHGVYNKATSNATANKTKGLLNAISTNVIDVGTSSTAAALTYWKVAEAMAAIHEQGGMTDRLVLGVSAPAMLQLNKDASDNQYLQGIVNIAGLNLREVVTPLGNVAVVLMDTLNDKTSAGSNTAVLFDPALLHIVNQPTPGKGNFFLEELAKTGAADKYEIFGQLGLDYGPEFCAAKLRYISNALPTGTL